MPHVSTWLTAFFLLAAGCSTARKEIPTDALLSYKQKTFGPGGDYSFSVSADGTLNFENQNFSSEPRTFSKVIESYKVAAMIKEFQSFDEPNCVLQGLSHNHFRLSLRLDGETKWIAYSLGGCEPLDRLKTTSARIVELADVAAWVE